MNMQITTRFATAKEAKEIIDFQIAMALETESLALDRQTVEKGVAYVFLNKEKAVYLVAEADNIVVGSLMLTYEWSDWRNGMVVWIQSVYVLPEHRKKGVFNSMFQFVKEMVDNNPYYCGIRLYVDKTNVNAQKVYTKLGMNGDHYATFELMEQK